MRPDPDSPPAAAPPHIGAGAARADQATEVITDVDRLRGLEADWRRLAVERGNAFLAPEWFFAWWRHYGSDLAPLVSVLRGADGRLRGLLPFAVSRSGRPRSCRIAGANLGDHFHPLAADGEECEVARAAAAALAASPVRWSLLHLDNVEPGPWLDALRDASPRPLRGRERGGTVRPVIDLRAWGAWEPYLDGRRTKFRKRIRQIERRLDKQRTRLRSTSDPSEVDGDMTTLFRLHDLRWAGRGGSSLASPAARAFHTDFAAAALRQGWLRLLFLEVDGDPAAAWYGWRIGDRFAFYNGGFDPRWSRLSPGLGLQLAVIRSAFEEGAVEFDFLLGEEEYKMRLADRALPSKSITLARARSAASLLAAADIVLRRLGRRLRGRGGKRSALARRASRLLPGTPER